MTAWTIYPSPLGQIFLSGANGALTGLWFRGQRHGPDVPGPVGSDPALELGMKWLDAYFSSQIPDFLPPLAPAGTPFQRRVWQALLEIPYGATVTYGHLARDLSCASAQAVGQAVGRNPIGLIIPCHRVVGADGRLTGYAGGLDKKAALLALEKGELPR